MQNLREIKARLHENTLLKTKVIHKTTDVVDFKCRVCANTWSAKLSNYLGSDVRPPRHGCPKCGKAAMAEKRKDAARSHFFKHMASIGCVVLENYRDSHTKIRCRCSCGEEFSVKPMSSRNKKFGCPTCFYANRQDMAYTKSEVLARLRERHGDRFKLLKYSGNISIDRSLLRCGDCGHTWSVLVGTVMGKKPGRGCPICSLKFLKPNAFGRKPYRLGKRNIEVQGFEPGALDLLRELGIKATQIRAGDDKDIPKVWYDFDGRKRLYFPDFYIPHRNLIVEVKGSRTFGVHDPEVYAKNCAKAKACIDAGYKFVMLFMVGRLGQIRKPLPKRWFYMSHTKLMKEIGYGRKSTLAS